MARKIWLAVSVGLNVVLLGVIGGFASVQFATYRDAHATLSQSPCYGPERCPAFQYDLFGDGTVVYQSRDTSHPAITYHISWVSAVLALWQLDNPQFNRQAVPGVGSIDTASCWVYYEQFGKTVENGCGTTSVSDAGRLAPGLRPLMKAVYLDFKRPDYAPSPPKDVAVKPYSPDTSHKVDAIA